jgi:hypothetical protein
MELWTFRNKKNNTIIRFSKIDTDDDLGVKYYFSENEYHPFWISNNISDLEYIKKSKQISPFEATKFNTPSIERVNIEKYDIVKFEN